MSNGLRDALGFIIPGADDPTEEIELFTIPEWEKMRKELDEDDKEKWWIPKCQCGGDKTYGKNSNLHSNWCPKYKR